MILPTTVTITGASDTTDIQDLVRLAGKYPKVEWGILNTRRSAVNGVEREPGLAWRQAFAKAAKTYGLRYSIHLCNSVVRELMYVPDFDVPGIINRLGVDFFTEADRIQLNTGRELMYLSPDIAIANIGQFGKPIIFQWEGVNGSFAYLAKNFMDSQILFDASCGLGLFPPTWLQQKQGFVCGYAGGIGPQNVMAVVEAINQANTWGEEKTTWWIDMETKIRSNDGFNLDLEAIETVLELTK